MPTWTSNIPSQVKTYANTGAFPVTGSVKTIYIAEDTDIAYYWTGSAYQSISTQDLSGLVPYTGATTDVDLGEFGIDTGFVQFDTTPTNTPTTQGALSWDTDDETLQLVMNGSIMKVGEDQFYPVKNQTGVAIPKGTAVRFDGTVGSSGRLLIAPYIADGSVPNSVFMGVTSETIDDGEDGKVMWFGRIRGINTNSFNEGDVLYASPTTAGAFTSVPNNKVQVCAVVTKSINNGVIFVRPSIFPTASELGLGFERRSDFVSPYHYSGSAPIGTANSGTWTIKRVDFTNFGSPVTLTATGSWDDRYILIYA